MLFLIFLSALNSPQIPITNYRGSDSKFISIIVILFSFFFIFSLLVYGGLRLASFLKFNKICVSSKLTSIEIGSIKQYMKRFHMRNPLEVILKQEHFDDLINRIAHFFESQPLSESDIVEKGEFFHLIRRKLCFIHSKQKKSIRSTRALKAGQKVSITFTDPETDSIYEFQTVILLNNEFYLGIKPPKDELNKILFAQEKLKIEVSFTYKEDTEYFFESRLVRLVNTPKIMWYIHHSKKLSQGDPQKPLDIPGTALVQSGGDEAKIEEMKIKIDSLSPKILAFCTVKEKKHALETGLNVLVSFYVDTSPITVRVKIMSTFSKQGVLLYRCNIQDLSREDGDRILKFVNKIKKQMCKQIPVGV